VPWVVVGAVAVTGGFVLALRPFALARDVSAWLPYVAHALGAAVAGATIVACAPLRPSREPLAAGVLAAGFLAMTFSVAPAPTFSWVPARVDHPWVIVVAVVGAMAAAATAGAWLGRRVTRSVASAAALSVLGGLVTIGTLVVLEHTAQAFLGASMFSRPWLLLLPFPIAAFAIQSLAPAYRPWVCGSGGLTLMAWTVMAREATARSIAINALAALVIWPIGYVGARLGWRLIGRRRVTWHREAGQEIPAARLQ